MWLVLTTAVLALGLAACTWEANTSDRAATATSETATDEEREPPVTGKCPVTIPNAQSPPGERRSRGGHGNGELWTVLPRDGVVRWGKIHPDGSIAVKFPWWAATASGDLTIEGRRLDVNEGSIEAEINPGWPESNFKGSGFWASEVVFSSEGCWEITGTVEDVSLAFIVSVVRPTNS